ncbi:SLBB domain-containing protein [Tenacibaculum finnmarkense]|uniref:SLBB domain-containing protein n=1 Tax=Tenacibaculum finnmarkense TaxID=2781243 RepID=UPI0023005235|nr:SLBB domain-containing protein [Tenacibaculum finnmarkense]WCC47585.1 SLBB domain-containing protein [Tenacibaculum finnmarkense]
MKKKRTLKKELMKVVCMLFILFASIVTYGQATQSQLNNIEVDNLSDKQVASYRDKSKKQGYTLEQALVMAKTKGMSELQAQKLKTRILNLGNNDVVDSKVDDKPEDKVLTKGSDDVYFGLTGGQGEAQPKEKLFGYDFFNNPNISFTPNLNVATPENYIIGAGDVISVDLWGAAEANYDKKVNRQGAINIQGVGYIHVVGLPIKAAKSKIKNYLKRIYAGITASSNSYNKVNIAVSIKEVRNVQVSIVGEVKVPGSYSLSAFSTVLNSLYAAGGPTKNGTLRNIRLFRAGEKIADFDFYEFLVNGLEKGNITVQDQDVIIVKPYEKLVTIEGAVKRPGLYEMKASETLSDLLNYCSGFVSTAYKQTIVIERVNGIQREMVEIPETKLAIEKLKDGDFIKINQIADEFSNRISIKGAIFQPGNYQYKENLSVTDLLKKAAGITKEAFLDRAVIVRTYDETKKETISFSLKENNDKLFLKQNDEVYIFSKKELKEKEFITINGAVNKGRKFDFMQGMQIEDLIVLAGGLKAGADAKTIDVSRRLKDGSFETISKNFNLSANTSLEGTASNHFILKPFDIISVRYLKGYTKQKTVFIKGETNFEGEYAIGFKNEKISDLIKKAGGLTKFAYVEGAFLTRKNNTKEDKKQSEILTEFVKKDMLGTGKQRVNVKKSFKIGINLRKILAKGGAWSKYNLILEEGDELFIPSERQTVKVEGEVLSPSLVRYEKRKSFKQYIENSGGFSAKAKKSRAYVIHANGDIKTTKRFLFFKSYPKVKPGSVILVPNKPESVREISTQEVIAITTGLATLGVLVKTLTDK